MKETPPLVDVLIIGGSYAGLSTAYTLYRALHTCVIFDSHKPRNSYRTPIWLTPQWEGQDPEKVREEQRTQLAKSGLVKFVDLEVTEVEKMGESLFKVACGEGEEREEWLGRRLLLAMGAVDIFPDVKGYGDCYARGMYVSGVP